MKREIGAKKSGERSRLVEEAAKMLSRGNTASKILIKTVKAADFSGSPRLFPLRAAKSTA